MEGKIVEKRDVREREDDKRMMMKECVMGENESQHPFVHALSLQREMEMGMSKLAAELEALESAWIKESATQTKVRNVIGMIAK